MEITRTVDDPTVRRLAEALAVMIHEVKAGPGDVDVYVEDAEAIAADFRPVPATWKVEGLRRVDELGVGAVFTVNGQEYAISEDPVEPPTPRRRTPDAAPR